MVFKEWAVICEALGKGRQSLILRKGGIAEGRQGFEFKYDRFFLLPTGFHQQGEMVHLPSDLEVAPLSDDAETLTISCWCELIWSKTLTDWEAIIALKPHHIWKEEVIRDRYEYEKTGMEAGAINAALVRVYQLNEPWSFANRKAYGGCRSWVDVPAAEVGGDALMKASQPVMDNQAFEALQSQIENLLFK